MIHRHYKEGEKLDVAGLNEITVLVDRSETELTEVGHNCWTPRQDGPPHKHNDKEQIFFVTSGEGIVKLGDLKFNAKPGNIAYVPAGLVHQTITTGDERLCYMLYNAFINPGKEGHASFKDHIEKVKQVRRQQADSGDYGLDETESLPEIKKSKFIDNIYGGEKIKSDYHYSIQLLQNDETHKSELLLYVWSANIDSGNLVIKNVEQTMFILQGSGVVSLNDEKADVKPGEVIFIPGNSTYSIKSSDEELICLTLNVNLG